MKGGQKYMAPEQQYDGVADFFFPEVGEKEILRLFFFFIIDIYKSGAFQVMNNLGRLPLCNLW